MTLSAETIRRQHEEIEAMRPLPRAIVRELASVPGIWVDVLVSRFPGERPDLVRLVIATLLDTDVAWAPMPGRIALRGWARDALRGSCPVDGATYPLRDLDPVAT